MRTMPWDIGSSVDVVSTDLAQRRHRSTSTEATGPIIESMLWRKGIDTSESEDDVDDELE
jgi:hypothetical protein